MKQLLIGLTITGLIVGTGGCGKDNPTNPPDDLLTWTTTWDDGSVKEEYQYYLHPETNERINHGWYNAYTESGEYYEGGIYKDDKKNGEWIVRGEYCEIYENLSAGTPQATFDFYWNKCENGGKQIYDNGVCVEGCEGDE